MSSHILGLFKEATSKGGQALCWAGEQLSIAVHGGKETRDMMLKARQDEEKARCAAEKSHRLGR